jgi:hypothetical protein
VKAAEKMNRDWKRHIVRILVQMPFDAFLVIAGRAISTIQTRFKFEPAGRTLTADELNILTGIFDQGVDYEKIIIKEGHAGLLGISGRPFTFRNVIYVPEKYLPIEPALLIHECCHIWQYQTRGSRYMSESLWAQFFGDGYDWRKGVVEGKKWEELNPEQQAALLEASYHSITAAVENKPPYFSKKRRSDTEC